MEKEPMKFHLPHDDGRGGGNKNKKESFERNLITPETIDSDLELKEFLSSARVSKSKRGDGVFISGVRGADTTNLRGYGIPVPGCLIVPTKGDVDLEVNRISELVETLRNEYLQKEQLAREEEIRKQRIARIEKNKEDVAPFLKLLNEYRDLVTAVYPEDSDVNYPHIQVLAKGTEVLNIGVDSMTLEKVRELLETERVQAPLRSVEFINKISKLQKKLKEAQIREIEFWGWGKPCYGSAELYQRPEKAVKVQSFSFGNIRVGWSSEDYDRLSEAVEVEIKRNFLQREKEMSVIKEMSFVGSSVKASPAQWGYGGNFPTRLEVDGKIIEFETIESAKEAEQYALEHGAFLPHHHALGERFRDRAKQENWSERKSKIALSVINGFMPELKKYTAHGKMPDRKGGGRTQWQEVDWFVEGEHLGYGPGADKTEELRFALELFCEINGDSVILQGKQIPDFTTVSYDKLDAFGKSLIHEKKLIEKKEEIKKLRVKIRVYQAESRYSGNTVAEVEGLFDDTIKIAIGKIDYYSTPRRGFRIGVTRINEDGTEGRTESESCSKGDEVIRYLKNLKKNTFVYGLEDFPELIQEEDAPIESVKSVQETMPENHEEVNKVSEPEVVPKDDTSNSLTYNPFGDALKDWGDKN